ncbi:MAG: hypothetical protein K6A82_09635 [Prevotella sp.]|nr:hypothetical protein [Prevotella sp.]
MDIDHYPYRFVKKVEEPWDGPQGFLLFKYLYSFKSPKSHQTYWVWIEVYQHNFYAIKFHLKAHRDSDKKYNIMTGLNEPRECIRTCIAIMNEIAQKDSLASFGFIGANKIDEEEENTARFRVYRRYMLTLFGSKEYEHMLNVNKSAYLLVNKKQITAHPTIIEDIVKGFKQLYPYFD